MADSTVGTDISILIGGDAGLGVESGGAALALAGSRARLHVLATPDARSRIRGGHNFYQVRLSDSEVHASARHPNLLVALTPDSVTAHLPDLLPGAAIIYPDGMQVDEAAIRGRDIVPMPLPLKEVASEHGSPLMVNSGALASAAAVIGLPRHFIDGVIQQNFARKGEQTVARNLRVAETMYDMAASRYPGSFSGVLPMTEPSPSRLLLNGNQALALGALGAGCRFISAYPMTPATSIFEELCAISSEYDVVTKHTEDEIAAVCMAIGASFVGARAMTSTSGGGFCLMVEALGLAGMAEVPLVVVDAQRAGPSTGLPTRTEQSDLLFAIHAGHGEFPRIVIAPGSVADCFEAGWRSFNLADAYQCPVIVMTDTLLATTLKTLDVQSIDFDSIEIDRGDLIEPGQVRVADGYERFADTPKGVSPRTLPGDKDAVFSVPSDEHDERGHITEDSETRIAMMKKRMRKLETAASEMRGPELVGDENADITLVCWGSTVGPCLEAARIIAESGSSANVLKFTDLWPLPAELVLTSLRACKRPVLVEQNFTGQLGRLLRMETGYRVECAVNRYDGRPFTPDELAEAILEEVNVHARP